ncbi:aldo/keto reductase [Phycisphaerales bacterium AB-hyl4]|uniref:Aldo/keto reductase n=1 Tax=Natronomicrosphaera hydrolytica TaxID=3242702 RepID=A0ABV4U528_9BACT
MEKVTFGRTGLEVSQLGFGGAPIGFLDASEDKVAHILNEMLDEGLNLIDTAANYPGSEQRIGKTMAGRRDEFILVSKCGHKLPDLEGEAWSPKLIRQTVDQSLKRLNTDHLDVMLLHSCSLQVLEQGEALAALVKAREAGKVRFVGYSGDNEAAAYAANLNDIEVLQLSINITDQANLDTVLPIARERNLGVMAKRPLANAAWRELTEQPGMYSQYAETYTQRLAAMKITPDDVGFPGHAELEWPEVALRFTLSHPGVHTAIVGTTSVINARANLSAVRKGPLPDDVVHKLREAFKTGQATLGQTWTGQT